MPIMWSHRLKQIYSLGLLIKQCLLLINLRVQIWDRRLKSVWFKDLIFFGHKLIAKQLYHPHKHHPINYNSRKEQLVRVLCCFVFLTPQAYLRWFLRDDFLTERGSHFSVTKGQLNGDYSTEKPPFHPPAAQEVQMWPAVEERGEFLAEKVTPVLMNCSAWKVKEAYKLSSTGS